MRIMLACCAGMSTSLVVSKMQEAAKAQGKEDYKILNTEIRKFGYNIPPLVNAYMSLSPTMRVFGTAINYEFGDVEETGILIAVDEILAEKRIRHIQSFVANEQDVNRFVFNKKP